METLTGVAKENFESWLIARLNEPQNKVLTNFYNLNELFRQEMYNTWFQSIGRSFGVIPNFGLVVPWDFILVNQLSRSETKLKTFVGTREEAMNTALIRAVKFYNTDAGQ